MLFKWVYSLWWEEKDLATSAQITDCLLLGPDCTGGKQNHFKWVWGLAWWHPEISLKFAPLGTSQAVQGLRLHASTAGCAGFFPGQATKIPHAAQRGGKKNPKLPLLVTLSPLVLCPFHMSSLLHCAYEIDPSPVPCCPRTQGIPHCSSFLGQLEQSTTNQVA